VTARRRPAHDRLLLSALVVRVRSVGPKSAARIPWPHIRTGRSGLLFEILQLPLFCTAGLWVNSRQTATSTSASSLRCATCSEFGPRLCGFPAQRRAVEKSFGSVRGKHNSVALEMGSTAAGIGNMDPPRLAAKKAAPAYPLFAFRAHQNSWHVPKPIHVIFFGEGTGKAQASTTPPPFFSLSIFRGTAPPVKSRLVSRISQKDRRQLCALGCPLRRARARQIRLNNPFFEDSKQVMSPGLSLAHIVRVVC